MGFEIPGLQAFYTGSGSAKDLYGTKPKVPDLEATTKKAITGSLNLIPDVTKLAGAFNTASQEALNAQFEQALPGFGERLSRLGEITDSLLNEGKYPDSLQKAIEGDIARHVAATSFGSGTGGAGSGFGQFDLARQLGIQRLKAFETGRSTLEQWTQMGKQRLAPSLALGEFMISPEKQFQRDWMQSLVTAAPDPVTRGKFDTTMGLLGMIMGMYGGGSYKPAPQQQWPGQQNTQRPITYQQQPPPSNVYGSQYQSTPLPAYYGSEMNPASGYYQGTSQGPNEGTGESAPFDFGGY